MDGCDEAAMAEGEHCAGTHPDCRLTNHEPRRWLVGPVPTLLLPVGDRLKQKRCGRGRRGDIAGADSASIFGRFGTAATRSDKPGSSASRSPAGRMVPT